MTMINSKISVNRSMIKILLVCLAVMCVVSCRAQSVKVQPVEEFTFVQVCDPQLGFSEYKKDKESFRQAVRQINALRPELVVVCGDMVNTADDRSYTDFKAIVNGLSMPYYCVPGNHDVGNEPTTASLQTYRQRLGQDYFVVEHKGAAFIFVNTQLWKNPVEGETEKQDIWLKESLQAALAKGQLIFVVGHYPLFCKQADEPDEYMNLPKEKRVELLALFEHYQVAAVLGGHTHKLTLNLYNTIQMVNGEATSRNLDSRPLGFRVWHVQDQVIPRHEFVALDQPASQN
ncbi:MAG: metallophosphoesterase [Sedimentisphaerales bacterium]|nr:metallophosphoesterase [Sedimentisphaerales bacterium]